MKQAIAGVAPSELQEVTVMVIWPSNSVYWLGRKLGQAYAWRWPGGRVFCVGNVIALMTIPLALVLYFLKVLPYIGMRYRLTNRRVIIERGLMPEPDKWIQLDRFDRIDVQVAPGQAWYVSGNLIFYRDDVETFRLEGVSRPDAFRQCCLKSQLSYVGVQKALARQSQIDASRPSSAV